jgi:hypothetical protein
MGTFMGVIDTAKEAVQLVQKIDNIELYQKILDLQSDALKIVEENSTLRGKVKELEQAFAVKDTLVFEDNAYFVIKESSKEGPYCTLCWDKDRTLVRKHKDDHDWWWCLIHQKERKYATFA